MINIRDVEILDILPYTFKTEEYRALSQAISRLSAEFYDTLSSVLFWADIENASSAVLDAMAAELDTPFYSTDMTDERKRAVIAAAFVYNSRAGTVAAVNELLAAAFGNAALEQWYEYDGEPYYFKIEIYLDSSGTSAALSDYEFFLKNLDKVKPKRAKLEGITSTQSAGCETIYAAPIAVYDRQKQVVRAVTEIETTAAVTDTVYAAPVVVRDRQTQVVPAAAVTFTSVTGNAKAAAATIYDRQTIVVN